MENHWYIVAVRNANAQAREPRQVAPVIGPFTTREECDETWKDCSQDVFEACGSYSEWKYTWGTAAFAESKGPGKANHIMEQSLSRQGLLS